MNPDIAAVLSGEKRYALVCSDNQEILPTLPDKSVAHVITDPPYEAEAHTKQRRIKTAEAPDSTDRDLGRGVVFAPVPFPPITTDQRREAAAQFVRLSARWMLIFCQAEASHKWAAEVVRSGGRYRRTNIWVKPDGQPQLNGLEPAQGYESICLCHSQSAMSWNGGGKHGVFIHATAPGSPLRAGHPTEKPIALMLELVSLFTDPDDIVLDPFSGSGTTGVACLRLGRRFIGCERDPKYAAVATDRLIAESRGQSLKEFRSGQTTLF